MATHATKHILWGGPRDGTTVEVVPGQTQYRTWGDDHPLQSTEALGLGQVTDPVPPRKQGLYEWNTHTGRFEWKGYTSD